jgi:hypothetical protein
MAAAGMELSTKLALPLIFNISSYSLTSTNKRTKCYMPQLFPEARIDQRQAWWNKPYAAMGGHLIPQRALNPPLRLCNRQIYREKSLTYEPRFAQIKGPVYVRGFFQSFLYFPSIINEFGDRLRDFLRSSGGDSLKRESAHSVCIHIRGSDLSRPPFSSVYGLKLSQYRTYILRSLENLNYNGISLIRVFTDDVPLASSVLQPLDLHLEFDTSCYESDFNPLVLMQRMATHHKFIGSRGSTFSWWVARLISGNGGSVSFPHQWSSLPHLTGDDVYLPSWHRTTVDN